MSKREILTKLRFGHRVAEDELDQLTRYFVETDLWQRVFRGEIDIVYGMKGSGKSAIYGLLLSKEAELFDNRVLLAPAENPQGAPAFAGIASDPPTSETEFRALWKLYLISLSASILREYEIEGEYGRQVVRILENDGLLPRGKGLSGVLSAVRYYASQALRPQAVQGGIDIDPVTGIARGFTGKIIFQEPAPQALKGGYVSVDNLLHMTNLALDESNFDLWLLLDRLDVAFADNDELERNALRALFRVYLDLASERRIHLKIFLRSDIWESITNEGFREASHITRHTTINWDTASLLNLMVRRIVSNVVLHDFLEITPDSVLASAEAQREFFYMVFPDQVDLGEKKPDTLDWMISRTRDGFGITAPRELIHLLNRLREVQMERIEQGQPEPEGKLLFERQAFKDALIEVSRTRVDQTLIAENPQFRTQISALRGQKATQYPESLAEIWGVSIEDADKLAQELTHLGLFEARGSKNAHEYWVPFLFRDALDLIQGAADIDADHA